MKGLSVLVGDIGAGKTTLARRMLDSLPEDEYEAALLVIIHSGVTANWLLRRIALQLGVENPAQEKLALLSQLYQRLLQIYESGKKAVVLIDEAQMLETRELMEEFRGLLNLEVPERKLISFVFFGLPEIERTSEAGSAARPAGGDALRARAASPPESTERLRQAPVCGWPARRGSPSPPTPSTACTGARAARRASSTPSATTRSSRPTSPERRRWTLRASRRSPGTWRSGPPRRRAATARRLRRAAGNVDLSEVDRYLESLKS